jgi:predicted sulfurtransferase
MIDTRREFLGTLSLSLLLTLGGAGFDRADAQDAPRIVAEELKQLVAKGEAVIVDVRSKSAWDYSHIDGAIHIPLAELESRLRELPKEKLIACYCT